MDNSDFVDLYVFGLKSIVNEPVTARAHLDMTWDDFLNNTCDIRVTAEDKVMVCTTSYAHHKRGWYALLNEKIRPFIEKFDQKKRKDKYSVRIAMQVQDEEDNDSGDNANVGQSSSSGMRFVGTSTQGQQSNTTSQFASSSSRKRGFGETTLRSQETARSPKNPRVVDSFSNGRPIYRGLHAQFSRPPNRTGVHEERQERVSISFQRNNGIRNNDTSQNSTTTNRQSRPQDSRVDLRPIVKERLKRFGNSFLLRVSAEIEKQRKGHMWARNVQHAPLTCYMLQELLTE